MRGIDDQYTYDTTSTGSTPHPHHRKQVYDTPTELPTTALQMGFTTTKYMGLHHAHAGVHYMYSHIDISKPQITSPSLWRKARKEAVASAHNTAA